MISKFTTFAVASVFTASLFFTANSFAQAPQPVIPIANLEKSFDVTGIIEESGEACKLTVHNISAENKDLTVVEIGKLKKVSSPEMGGAYTTIFEKEAVFSFDGKGKFINDFDLNVARGGKAIRAVHMLSQTPGSLHVTQNVNWRLATSSAVIDETFGIVKSVPSFLSDLSLRQMKQESLRGSRKLNIAFLPDGNTISAYTFYVMPVYSGIPAEAFVTATAFDELPKRMKVPNAAVVPSGDVAGQERTQVCEFQKSEEEKLTIRAAVLVKKETERKRVEAQQKAIEENLKATREREAEERFKQYTRPSRQHY